MFTLFIRGGWNSAAGRPLMCPLRALPAVCLSEQLSVYTTFHTSSIRHKSPNQHRLKLKYVFILARQYAVMKGPEGPQLKGFIGFHPRAFSLDCFHSLGLPAHLKLLWRPFLQHCSACLMLRQLITQRQVQFAKIMLTNLKRYKRHFLGRSHLLSLTCWEQKRLFKQDVTICSLNKLLQVWKSYEVNHHNKSVFHLRMKRRIRKTKFCINQICLYLWSVRYFWSVPLFFRQLSTHSLSIIYIYIYIYIVVVVYM